MLTMSAVKMNNLHVFLQNFDKLAVNSKILYQVNQAQSFKYYKTSKLKQNHVI